MVEKRGIFDETTGYNLMLVPILIACWLCHVNSPSDHFEFQFWVVIPNVAMKCPFVPGNINPD